MLFSEFTRKTEIYVLFSIIFLCYIIIKLFHANIEDSFFFAEETALIQVALFLLHPTLIYLQTEEISNVFFFNYIVFKRFADT